MTQEQEIWEELGKITDPEIPALTLVEMRVIREVRCDDGITVVYSPTYVGCPATGMILQEIRERLNRMGHDNVNIETTFTPPWSTDMLDEATREKLRMFGIAPPPLSARDLERTVQNPVCCPFCGKDETTLESSFGSTLCRQIYYCNNCLQSFERFKPL